MHSKLTLISAPAGFGKTTLVSEWVANCSLPVAWLSLDEGDTDPNRFLRYFITALQKIAVNIGAGIINMLQSPQPPSTESILMNLLNEITTIQDDFIYVLDDYHLIDSKPVDEALTYLLDHLPPQLHLVIATRQDPSLPLARLRARGQLAELRAADLRFTSTEAAEFLNQVMGLNLTVENIIALEARTEGWITGLQLAALSMKNHHDASGFIKAFTGSHYFVLDYLVEEVLQQQSESVQNFLLRTSILDRMCGSLCESVLCSPVGSGQETLEYLERSNLFIIPLDNERRWYRYHHLFAELLRQRLHQSVSSTNDKGEVTEYHIRASIWSEDNGLELEAFQHAVAANDVERASRLIQGKGMPLHVRGGLVPVLNWLESLPAISLDEKPILWVMYAGALTTAGQMAGVEQKLKAAEAALQSCELDEETRDIIGRIASNRATLAFIHYRADIAIVQANRALEYLHPDNLPVRTICTWVLGAAHQHKGDRTAAKKFFTDAISTSQMIGHSFVTKLATLGLGRVQENENRLYLANETYQHVLQLYGDYPLPNASEAYLGLARIHYEWNDLDAAEKYGQQSLRLARQWDKGVDRFIVCEMFLARLKLTKGDAAGAAEILSETEKSVRQNSFMHRVSELAALQVLVLLQNGEIDSAAVLAKAHQLPISLARVHLAQADPVSALTVLESLRREVEARNWLDELLKVTVLLAVALKKHGEKEKAAQALDEALALAEPGGCVRIFVDEGEAMRFLIKEQSLRRNHPLSGYVDRLLAAFNQSATSAESATPVLHQAQRGAGGIQQKSYIIDPLTERELEVLRLLRSELSGPEIAQQLIVSLNTFRSHTKSIFNKLGVNNRRAAIRRATELDLF